METKIGIFSTMSLTPPRGGPAPTVTIRTASGDDCLVGSETVLGQGRIIMGPTFAAASDLDATLGYQREAARHADALPARYERATEMPDGEVVGLVDDARWRAETRPCRDRSCPHCGGRGRVMR